MSCYNSFLFSPWDLLNLELVNRIVIAPMCTYQAMDDGKVLDKHFAHYAQFSLGGAGLIIVEASAVDKKGRISAWDLGLWCDDQIEPMARLVDFAHEQSTKIGIQLAHSGLKGSTDTPWDGNGYLVDEGGLKADLAWQTVGPSTDLLGDRNQNSSTLTTEGIAELVEAWGAAAARANKAGFDVIEIHGGHGYLISEFLSPLTNQRVDKYGGDFTGRTLFAREVVQSVRANWPKEKPLFFRISAIDGVDVGWSIEDSIRLTKELSELGVDLIDCSSGGFNVDYDKAIPRTLGFQVYLADAIKKAANIPVIAVGLITQAQQAEDILQSGKADLIAIGRTALNNPYWPRHAAHTLQEDDNFEKWPVHYGWWLYRWAKSLKKLKNAWNY